MQVLIPKSLKPKESKTLKPKSLKSNNFREKEGAGGLPSLISALLNIYLKKFSLNSKNLTFF